MDESPALKLWALVAAETRILLSSNWNIGRLYQLPVANSEEFNDYHDARRSLEDVFRDLAAEIVGDDDPRIEMPFQMTLAAIELSDNTGKAPYPLVDDALPAQHPVGVPDLSRSGSRFGRRRTRNRRCAGHRIVRGGRRAG